MAGWAIDRVVHFGPGDLVKDGCAHFGFHDRSGRLYAIEHQRHFLGLVGTDDRLEWTVAAQPVYADVPNIATNLEYPIYIDAMPDGSLVISNFGNARLYRVDTQAMSAELLVDGHAVGLIDMGNCVVDAEGCIWVKEVTGCLV